MQLHSKFGLLALFCISLKRFERIFLRSLHIISIMYIIRSETFIEIDSLQHLKISIFTVLTLCFFQKYCALYITPWLVHFSLNLSHLLHLKHWQYSYWNVLVIDICSAVNLSYKTQAKWGQARLVPRARFLFVSPSNLPATQTKKLLRRRERKESK